jgi:hypothetical protein
MQATGAALVLVFLPLMHDPALVWPFTLVALVTLGAAVAVWRTFRHIDAHVAHTQSNGHGHRHGQGHG